MPSTICNAGCPPRTHSRLCLASKENESFRRDYTRGWNASKRYANSSSYQVFTPLERADMNGESNAWYLGYEDYACDKPKWSSAK